MKKLIQATIERLTDIEKMIAYTNAKEYKLFKILFKGEHPAIPSSLIGNLAIIFYKSRHPTYLLAVSKDEFIENIITELDYLKGWKF